MSRGVPVGLWVVVALLVSPEVASTGHRGVVHVAVAANFGAVHERLATLFTAGTGHEVVSSTGSSGQLYAQIRNGAPYDVFLSADSDRPLLLEQSGAASAGMRFTYAVGRLALYGPSLDSVRAFGVDLRDRRHQRIAIANPKTAPYGAAAVQVLARLGLTDVVASRLVRGENVAQAYQFVHSGAAELGFVAASQVQGEPAQAYWMVPAEYHDVIAQDAVLLRRGEGNPAALAFAEFMRGGLARGVIESFGYDTVR